MKSINPVRPELVEGHHGFFLQEALLSQDYAIAGRRKCARKTCGLAPLFAAGLKKAKRDCETKAVLSPLTNDHPPTPAITEFS